MMNDLLNTIEYSQNLKLLYVEDNEEARNSTIIILEEFFKTIIIAVDGEDGFEKFKKNEIDIIITDINMPKLNGLEMTKKIKNIDNDIPILILSAYNESNYFMDSIKYGNEGYLLKPIDMKQFLSVLRKITDKFKLKEEAKNNLHFLKEYQDATNHSSIVSKADINGYITFVNDKFCEISGYTQEELIGSRHNIVKHPDTLDSTYKNIWNSIKYKKHIWEGVLRNISKNRESYYVKIVIKPILDADGNIVEYIALSNNITNIMNPKKQLQDLINSIDNTIAVMIKIEQFEDIENFYHQKTAQKIEDEFSSILMDKMPKKCEFERVFSLGNGEFVFAKNGNTCKIGITNMIPILKEFQKSMNEVTIDIDDLEYNISILLSVACEKNVLENIKYGIKKLRKTNQDFIIANNLIENEKINAKRNIETLKKVKRAISNSKIICYFQPIIDNKTLKIKKYESLVRLIDENGEVLPPIYFLDIVKKGKYYSKITDIVLEQSFNALNTISVDISINISVLDIEQETTRNKLFKLLEKNKQHSSRIVLELLEDEDIKDFKTILSFIEKVKTYGVRIAIDDFGSGYSNFKRLLNYQPDILKIDGSLIKNIANDSFSLNIVETIVTFAKKQNILTVAEYVESKEVYDILCSLGIDYSQGYYFAKPTPLELL